MTHNPAVSRLAERNMTRHRILTQIAAAAEAISGKYRAIDGNPRERWSRDLAVTALQAAATPGPPCPPVVCLCGSTRFADEFNRQRKNLAEDGQIVLSIEIVTTQAPAADPQHADPALKARLDELHKRKIDLADYVLVLNVGGYTGESTRSEIAYARALGKPVSYLEPPEGPGPGGWACRRCGDAWHGTPPDDLLCPGGCQAAA